MNRSNGDSKLGKLPHVQLLGELRPGARGVITKVQELREATLTLRLMEMGLLEGGAFEVVHEAPFSRDPIVVRVRGSLIALRREEANSIEVVLS